MISELKPEIIHTFRNKVHEHNDFIRLYFVDYKPKNNIEGKDIWSKICSCMDWLTVAVEGILSAAAYDVGYIASGSDVATQ